jgi:hypothetical protein
MTARFAIGSVSFVLCAALCASGCGKTGDSTAGPGSADPPTAAHAGSSGQADFSLDASQWHAEFSNDPTAAVEKYRGKVIELSGTVEFVSEDPAEQVGCVYMKVDGPPLQDRCATMDKKPWLKVSPGSTVKLRGKVPDFGLPRDLVGAEIVETGPNPAVVISAPQLAKEYAANGKAATEKFDDKWAHVDGEVLEKAMSKDCAVLLKLKGEDDVIVSCCFGERNKRPLEQVKVGTKVKVFGQLSLWKEKEVLLNSPILSEPR